MAKEYDVTEHVDFADYPNLDYAGKRMIKEIEHQIFKSPHWNYEERRWFNWLRNSFLATFEGYEERNMESYQKGLQEAVKMSGIDFDFEDYDND